MAAVALIPLSSDGLNSMVTRKEKKSTGEGATELQNPIYSFAFALAEVQFPLLALRYRLLKRPRRTSCLLLYRFSLFGHDSFGPFEKEEC